jgi:peptidoglycan/xylan/chitin deacetylase (PgdA/CDA1 family)
MGIDRLRARVLLIVLLALAGGVAAGGATSSGSSRSGGAAPGESPTTPGAPSTTQPQRTTPSRPRRRARVPVGCRAGGPAFVLHGSRRRRVVALTFDDGPWPDTPAFVRVLERERVHATFFMIGRQVAGHGALLRRMLADGDMIGDHTWSHPVVAGAGAFAANQIRWTESAIIRASDFRPCLFRAPDGAVSGPLIALARRLGFTTIQWDVDPTDWARPGAGAIVARVLSHVGRGSIVLMHDGGGPRGQTLAALPAIVHALRRRGYRFATVTALIGARLRYR